MNPPTIAPVILPSPPRINTANPLNPITTPIIGSTASKDKPTNTPAAEPNAEANMTVTEITKVGLIPNKDAVSVLKDTARIALPILVFLISTFKININTMDTPRPMI